MKMTLLQACLISLLNTLSNNNNFVKQYQIDFMIVQDIYILAEIHLFK